jgi:hypothetical protein
VGSNSGRVKKSRDWVLIMCFERTCLQMYRRKASDDQRPMSMIVKTGTPARDIAMAPPNWTYAKVKVGEIKQIFGNLLGCCL